MTKKEVKCYDCNNALDIRTKAKVLRDKDLEWVCGDCNKKEVMKGNKIITKTTTGFDKPKPFYEKGIIGKVKRYLWDDTVNDMKKIGKNVTNMGDKDKE